MTFSEDNIHPLNPDTDAVPQDETSNEGAETISAPSGSSGSSSADPANGGVDFSEFEEDMGPGSLLVQVQKELDQTKDDLARSRAETYNAKQDFGSYVRRSKEDAGKRRVEGQQDVVEAILPVMDDIAAARAAGELADGPFASIADKLEGVLRSGYGYDQFGAPGDKFDPELHDALMMQPNPDPDVDVQVVGQVLQPGYRAGERVLRPAKVLVFDPA